MNGDVVRLSVPARAEYIIAVRLAVSAVAERTGFDIENIEDLKVASAEACGLLLAAAPEKLELAITVSDGLRLDFTATGKVGTACAEPSDGLSQYLLDALVDSCALEYDGDTVKGVRLEKKQ